jgi:hypothetical protein
MPHKILRLSVCTGLIISSVLTGLAFAVDKTWTPTMGNSFFENANWVPAGAPGTDDKALVLDPTVEAVMNFTGTRTINSFHLGETGATGGRVRFSAGELNVPAEGDARSHIGDRNSLDSTFIMEGSAVLLFDHPLDGGGGGLGSAAGDEDIEVGAQTGESGALGKLELHDAAVLRLSDDLKIGAEANGNGEVLMDGNSVVTVGSGVSVSESGGSKGKLTVGGNALLVSGNSAGAGNTAQGVTNEGYFTLSTNGTATADVLIRDSAKVYVRTLQQRNGVSNMTIQDNGEFHVFDTFAHAAPNLGVATIKGDPFGPQRASAVAEAVGSVFNLTLRNNAKVSIDSAMDEASGALYQGLALSGGNNRAVIIGTGGESNIAIRDSASFVVQQNLYMTLASAGGAAVGAASTLSVRGPDATVDIRGDLYMSFDPNLQTENADPSTIEAVITGNTHSTIEVGDLAHIQFGNLAVEFDGYSPVGGETYTLLTAASITGTAFRATSLPMLPTGLSWDLDVGTTSVTLGITGSLPGVQGDFNGNGVVDAADYVLWRNGGPLQNDPTPDVQPEDYDFWRARFGNRAGGGASGVGAAVPEPVAAVQLIAILAGTLISMYRCRKVRRVRD